MIAEEKKRAVIAAITQLENEQLLARIEDLLREAAALDQQPRQPLAPPGFAAGSITFLTEDWDAPLPDEDWAHNALHDPNGLW